MKMRVVFTAAVLTFGGVASAQASEILSLEELMLEEVSRPGTHTKTEKRKTPVAVTHISKDMIDKSGARSLQELLEVYVPNFQVLRHHFVGYNVGSRGLLSDLNDKLLLLVNGKVMNHLTFYGADSEMMMSMLGDISHIDVIRGPGSAVYGPGAISTVIDIHTFGSQNFNGTEVSFRQGIVEEFSSMELKLGRSFGKSHGLFFYGGIDYYQGADYDDAPSFYSIPVQGVPAHSSHDVNFEDDKASSRNKPRYKLHLQYNSDDFEFWTRYTHGGERFGSVRERYQTLGEPVALDIGYQQFTVNAEYRKKLSSLLKMKLSLSYDFYNRHRLMDEEPVVALSEDEYRMKLAFNWSPSAVHEVAFGIDGSYARFGRETLGFPHVDATPVPPNIIDASGMSNGEPWEAWFWGAFIEDNWSISPDWTLFTGLRLDEHEYTDYMWSPRASLIFTPNAQDTWKFIYNKSLRRTSDFYLRYEYVESSNNESDEVENLDNFELRYERRQNKNWFSALSVYYSTLEVIGFNGVNNNTIGDLKVYGAELELTWKNDFAEIGFSHGYSKLIELDLEEQLNFQVFSSEPYGYGDDLEHWANHITKLYGSYHFNEKWTLNGSMVYYWSYPGAEDYAAYNETVQGDPNWFNSTLSDSDDKAFGKSVFVNAGLHYKHNDNLDISLNAYNVLGWLDKDYNKRNYFFQMGTYTNEAASLALRVTYRF